MTQFSIHKLTNQLPTWVPFSTREKFKELKKDDKSRYTQQVQPERTYASSPDQDDLKRAITVAEDPIDPRRTLLIPIYREALRDLHLRSQIEMAINKVLSEGWAMVDANTYEINNDLTKLMERRWFEDMRRLYLLSEWWGLKLGEFGKFKETKNGIELINIKEFPPENVIPQRGLILANQHAQIGVPFRPDELPEDADPALKALAEAAASFLFECGDRDDIGLLSIAAKYSIYKKYAVADWARASEKSTEDIAALGTDSEDDAENKKKADSLANLNINSWMVYDKGDDLKFLEKNNTTGFNTIKEFIAFLDADNSKGANGQTGSSDEKSFVGSAEVHERILDNYTDRRIRSLQYWINEEALPKLIELRNGSTAYKALEGHIWMPLRLINEDSGLDSDVDEEEDEVTDPPPQPAPPKTKNLLKRGGASKPGKFKAPTTIGDAYGLATELQSLYNSTCKHHHANTMINGIDELMEKYVKRIYKRNLKPGKIDHDLANANADKIWSGIKQAFDANLTSVKFGTPEHRLRMQLKYNIYVMAAFKNHHNTVEVFNQLFDKEGKLKPFSGFKKDVLSINNQYNVNWLKTEYNLAQASGRMASKWMTYSKKGGSIVYVAILDGNTRLEHEGLNGATYPVDHSFWNSYFPPNGYGCRCSVRWINRVETVEPSNPPDLKAIHRNNPGQTGRVFNEAHPYFEVQREFAKNAERLFGFQPPVDLDRFIQNMAIYETLKVAKDYTLVDSFTESGGFVFRHKKYDKKDYQLNETAALKLGKAGYAVEVREHVTESGVKNPELVVSGKVTDLKTPESVKGLKTAFRSARRQGVDFVLLELNDKWTAKSIQSNLIKAFFYNPEINEVLILWKGKEFELTREDYLNGKLYMVK